MGRKEAAITLVNVWRARGAHARATSNHKITLVPVLEECGAPWSSTGDKIRGEIRTADSRCTPRKRIMGLRRRPYLIRTPTLPVPAAALGYCAGASLGMVLYFWYSEHIYT